MFTEYSVIVAGVFLLLVEYLALRNPKDKKLLITTVMRRWAKKSTLLPFGAGLLAGHFFWCG